MKVILISFNTPSSENIRGASALPYHLLAPLKSLREKRIEEYVSSTIYSYNANKLSVEKILEVQKEMGVTIKVIPLPKWYVWIFKLHLLFLRVLLKYPLGNYIMLPQRYVNEVKAENPDLIWVYGEEQSRIVKQFPEYQRIQIGPDTESLYYYRMMGQRFVMNNPLEYWKCALMYRKYARMEREFCTDENFTYYAVGEEDVRHLQQLNPKVRTRFLRHPHYEVLTQISQFPQINYDNSKLRTQNSELKRFHQPKIKVLIAGQYNLYMKQEADLLVEQICNVNTNDNENYLREHYSITFLGKGWERHVEAMRNVGYEVQHITFAPDYIEEICRHDIQITPIAIGTGTKGKVLDALANGLLVIGTPYAMENIAVKNGESCIEYRHPQEVIEVLKDIPKNIKKYEKMALLGQEKVLEHHNRKLIAKTIFGKV
jgi:hypothetical protein